LGDLDTKISDYALRAEVAQATERRQRFPAERSLRSISAPIDLVAGFSRESRRFASAGGGRVAATVASRSSAPFDGMVEVEIKLSNALPDGSIAGTEIDSTIEIERLQNVLYVGRPVIGSAGRHCGAVSIGTRRGVCGTRVGIIRASLSQRIEIREGLREGDKVILSDMSAWRTSIWIRLE